MKKFYYFSKTKLKFVEIRNFYRKFVFLILFFSILVSFLIFGTFLIFDEFINPDSEVKTLKKNNAELKQKFNDLFEKYKSLDTRVAQLFDKSHDLRLATNLEPITKDEELYGIGGSAFTPIKSLNPGDITDYLDNLETYINKVALKVNLERNNYEEIEKTLKENELLYESIPAIKPCEGYIYDDFGIRLHPILKIRRMHPGVDIITDIGTKVYAPGSGVVDFIGRRGGYGLTLEIDHGFGLRTLYAHLASVSVKQGKKINRGDLVALSGNSGSLTTGPHLHYEVRKNSIPLNSHDFIYDDVQLFEIVRK